MQRNGGDPDAPSFHGCEAGGGKAMNADTKQKVTPADAERLRADLAQHKARYDGGAVSPAVFTVITNIERELAWAEHDRGQP
jgi:hypothetical protein